MTFFFQFSNLEQFYIFRKALKITLKNPVYLSHCSPFCINICVSHKNMKEYGHTTVYSKFRLDVIAFYFSFFCFEHLFMMSPYLSQEVIISQPPPLLLIMGSLKGVIQGLFSDDF